MKQFIALVKKEFFHVLRDRRTLLILIGMPIVQILIFGFALTNEISQSKMVVINPSRDPASQVLLQKIGANPYFELTDVNLNPADLPKAFKEGSVKLALVFPTDFGKLLQSRQGVTLQVIADGTDPNTATTLTGYLNLIIQDFHQSYQKANSTPISQPAANYHIQVVQKMLYNPQLKGAPNFVPGVMALVLMLICVLMTAVSIVKEKETGTMEVLLVSPFKAVWVILSKSVPYFLLSLLNVISIILLSVFALHLPIAGSLLLLIAESMLFIITCLALGIFISIQTNSQQTAMLVSLMGMLLPTILFSGFMFPIENMPVPLQWFSNIIPAKWYYIIVKDVMIKGLGFTAIWKETAILIFMSILLILISLKTFKVRLE